MSIPEQTIPEQTIPEQTIPEIRDRVIDPAGLHALFYNTTGCVVLKGVYEPELMERYNAWCARHLDSIVTNARHPKQWSKRLINDVMERMADDDPRLLAALVDNPRLTAAVDALLGFARFGAVTTHWNEPGGDRQQTHVDYPCHVKSGPFWEDDPAKLKRMFTTPQLEHSLVHYSVQALIAADAMGQHNGSTEVIPGSHLEAGVDTNVLTHPEVYESRFINAELDQGDVLLFSRRLVHRGGKNISDARRNSLIIQFVWLMGVGQHTFDHAAIVSKILPFIDAERRDAFKLRVKGPFPIDTTLHT